MSETIEEKCLSKGVKLTDQRKIIAQVMSKSSDHPDVDELYNRVSKIDPKISIATVYRTVKLFEESGILAKHEFKGGKARYEELNDYCRRKVGHSTFVPSDGDRFTAQAEISFKAGIGEVVEWLREHDFGMIADVIERGIGKPN